MSRTSLVVLACACSIACTDAATGRSDGATKSAGADPALSTPAAVGATSPGTRVPIDGHDFPDGVLALTWDDGPDSTTLDLARFLARQHVSATFFVVGEWQPGLSSEPGAGEHVLATGHRVLPVLHDLVGLGHRLGNHTFHHALLDRAAPASVRAELEENQRFIDPFLTNELRVFRAPGGAWSESAARAVDDDAQLRDLVGPVGWDVDRKDWEDSLYCRSDQPAAECEPAAPGGRRRVRAAVTAQRYLATIASKRHGIVLFHDRVGHVGSAYALDVARIVVPELVKRGYAFAAPVLHFSALSTRIADPGRGDPTFRIVDVDGDGRGDLCEGAASDTRCAIASDAPGGSDTDGAPKRTVFRQWSKAEQPRERAARDPDRDAVSALPDVDRATVRFADLNGDGRPDVCGLSTRGVVCALAIGHASFAAPTVWQKDVRVTDASHRKMIALGDVTGDGRADLCVRDADGIHCAAAP